jgi:hypothetical protein
MPFASEQQRKAMYAAAEGKSNIGIPEEVGKKFVAHRNDEDGETGGSSQPEFTELQVMEAIRDKRLASPQQFGDVALWAIRVTGTGHALRASGEIGYKSPADYLTQEFMTRCQGLPVVWEHPEKLLLDSESFRNQIIGTSVLPYVEGDEVWTIARIYDKEASQLMQEEQLSTSPAVSVSNSAIKIGNVLIEGNPVYVDHIAVCQNGVWDKQGEPTGVRLDSITREDKPMEEESKGEDLRGLISSLLEEHSARIDAKFDEVHNRLDGMSPKSDDDDDDKMKADEGLDPEEKEEVKEEIEESHHVVDAKGDGARCDDDDDDDKEEKEEAVKADSLEIKNLRRELAELKKAMKPAGYDEREAIAKAMHRADAVFMALGEQNTVAHVPGETALAFRKRLASKFAKLSERFKAADVSKYGEAEFAPLEDMVYADAFEYAKAPPIKTGSVHMIEKKMGNLSVWEPSSNSDPHGWMDTFSNGVTFRGGFIKH